MSEGPAKRVEQEVKSARIRLKKVQAEPDFTPPASQAFRLAKSQIAW